jgi:hypothetical protein
MRLFQLVTFLIAIPSLVAGQENEPAPRLSAPVPRKVTATAGVGNAMGWFGGQAEYYVARDRASLFAGLGYTLEVDEGDPSGATFALGARGFTPGLKHRGFLELSISQIAVRSDFFGDGDRFYGPGAQAGYQFVSRGGFTLMASLGAGHAHALAGLGLGYTWRSRAP